MLINGIEYKEIPVSSGSCLGCELFDRSANRGHGDCKNPEVVCIGVNRQDKQDVQFKRVK
jgi:hypothetical protein